MNALGVLSWIALLAFMAGCSTPRGGSVQNAPEANGYNDHYFPPGDPAVPSTTAVPESGQPIPPGRR